MIEVEITRATVAGGRRVIAGEVVPLTKADAMSLIAMGKAVPVVNAPVAENREAEIEKKTSKRAGATIAKADK
jgi:hypothetical protein